jgi:hypothetical protein
MHRALVLLLIAAAPAIAGADPVQLRFTRQPAAGACPDEASFRAAVISRLGYDPFQEDADRTLSVTLDADRAGLVADIELAAGPRRARKSIPSPRRDCAELASSVELIVILFIDPDPDPHPEPEIGIVEEPTTSPRPRRRRRGNLFPEETIERGHPIGEGPFHFGVGGFVFFGTEPVVMGGIRVELGVRLGAVTVAVEPWLSLPTSTAAPGGRVAISYSALNLSLCAKVGAVVVCGLGAGGVFQGVGQGTGIDAGPSVSTPFAAAGGRIVWESGLYLGLGLRAHAEILVPLTHTRLTVTDEPGQLDAWSSPYILPSVGVSAVGHFP